MLTLPVVAWLLLGGLLSLAGCGVWLIWLGYRTACCPHCRVTRRYFVGVQGWASRTYEVGPVRCKCCRMFFVFAA